MGTQIQGIFCTRCQTHRQATRIAPSHLAYFALMIGLFLLNVYLGCLWVVIWVCVILTSRPYHCTMCGESHYDAKEQHTLMAARLVVIIMVLFVIVLTLITHHPPSD